MSFDKIDFYFRVLDRYDQYINLANTKAMTQISLLGTFAIAATALIGWAFGDTTAAIKLSLSQTFLIIAFIAYIFTSFKWYYQSMQVIKPNTTAKKNSSGTGNQHQTPDLNELSTIFFGDVDKFVTFDSFKAQVENRTADKNYEDLLCQVHTMAHITNQKFVDYNKTELWMFLSFLLLLVILLLSCVIKFN